MKISTIRTMITKAAVIAAAAAAAMAFTACSVSSSSYGVTAVNSKVEVKADNSDKDSSGSADVTIGTGEMLVVESNLSSGEINIKVFEGQATDGTPVIDDNYSGTTSYQYTGITPGDYTVVCAASQDKTTGTLSIHPEQAPADVQTAAQGEEDEQTGGYTDLSIEDQIVLISEYTGCDPDNLEYEATGTLNDTMKTDVYRYTEDGNEADFRILVLDDGSILGYYPDKTLVDATELFESAQ